jgi:hypothetical protein
MSTSHSYQELADREREHRILTREDAENRAIANAAAQARLCPTCPLGVIREAEGSQCQACIATGATNSPNTHYEEHR